MKHLNKHEKYYENSMFHEIFYKFFKFIILNTSQILIAKV